MLKQNTHIILVIVVFFDLILLISGYLACRFITYGDISLSSWTLNEIILAIIIISVLYIALERFEFSHAYRFMSLFEIIRNIIYFEFFLTALFYLIILFNIFYFENKFVFYYIIITFTFYLSERSIIKLMLNILRNTGYNYKRYLIIGAGEVGLDFYRMIVSSKELGVKIIGFLDDNNSIIKSKDPIYTDKIKSLMLGSLNKIESILKTKMIDNVIIALPMNAEEKIIGLLNICEKYGIKAELIPRYFKIITGKPSVRQIKKFTLIGIRHVPLENMFNRFIKRLFDLSFAVFGILLGMPIYLILMLLIKMHSKGPIFFLQKRTGYNQKEFNIIKFRTMIVNEDADKKQASKDDPRKTGFGDFLRKTNLDELPQLFNILLGQMSVVGPRPHMLVHTKEFNKKYDKYLVRHWVKPGLTGWAQVNGWRGDSDIGMRIKYDIDYIENWSIFFDIKIVFLTFFGRKVKKHAY